MNLAPEVSVVIGVHNGEAKLTQTLDSIFDQQDIKFECIVVDDGSTDATRKILDDRASKEARLRVFRQPHWGLTKALIAGCSAASGRFIARQDVGDISLPGRLSEQRALLVSRPDLAFVACQVASFGPEGESLGAPEPGNGGQAIIDSLLANPVKEMRGPNHGSVMFRRKVYEAVGGYRPEFYFAQDLDLWSRMIEAGSFAYLDKILYAASFAPGDISARHRQEQLMLRDLIHEATAKRRNGESDRDVLKMATRIRPDRAKSSRILDAQADYFIGSCLYLEGDPAAAKYFRRALTGNPFKLKAWAKLLKCHMRPAS